MIMKFSVESLNKCIPRLGKLSWENNAENVFQTPMAMLYTRGGSIPHITHEVFKLVCEESQIIQIPLTSTYNFHAAMSEYGESIANYVGLKDCLTFITLQDPGELTQSGHHVKDKVPIWTRNGKVMLDSDSYMDLIEQYKPDMYCVLNDNDTNIASPNKRIIKSVDNTLTFFDKCFERHTKSDILKRSFLFASITGGYNLKQRLKCINAISKNNDVGGYVIDGLHNNGPEVEFLPISEVKPIVKYIIEKLPAEKVRVIQGCWNPLMVLNLVQLGVDIFDTSYCYIVTERSAALTFSLETNAKLQEFEINLREVRYADDFQPILATCTCLTCSKHSRGYIHHLLAVQELLGPLLLTIHNVHHYLKFFEKIRECIRSNTLLEYQMKIAKEFKEYEKRISAKVDNISVVAAEG